MELPLAISDRVVKMPAFMSKVHATGVNWHFPEYGRLVPSSHNGSEFRYPVIRQLSRGDERIREDIPVPDSLGKEAFLIGLVC